MPHTKFRGSRLTGSGEASTPGIELVLCCDLSIVFKGYAVWRQILQRSKRLPPSLRMNHKHYSKSGTYDDALKDFHSVQPTNVHYVKEPHVSPAGT